MASALDLHTASSSTTTPFPPLQVIGPPLPAVRPARPSAVLASAALAADDDRLLLALERLESVPADAGAARDVAGLRAGACVAVGHLAHAQLIAPASGVVALAAGRVTDVVSTPERVDGLAAQVVDGDAWAAEELAAIAEASAHTDNRRAWHATERAARRLLGDVATPTSARRSLTWILAAAAHRRGDATGAAAMLTPLPGGDPGRLSEVAAIAVTAHDRDLGRRAAATARRLAQRNAEVLFLSALARHVAAVLCQDVEAQRSSAYLLAETRRPLLYAASAERAGMLTEALRVYEQCGATADAGRVRHAMTVTGVTPVAPAGNWDDLTDAELRVVRVVAAGATNRQAAHELFLSPHTVSSHLRHAFEKLGIRSRVELARLYAQRETGGEGQRVASAFGSPLATM
jgi:DNA-binding CsgD family transcriptional regulator